MKINDNLRVEPIFDYEHGRRFQLIVVNKEREPTFTTHHDIMAREYVKIKLTEADIMLLIQELNKNFSENDPKIKEFKAAKAKLKLITEKDEV